MLSYTEGQAAVQLARDAIETYLRTGEMLDGSEIQLPEIFDEVRGVFVTLTINGDLRGCIGHPYADSPLRYAITDSALSAALRDPRFPPVGISEMDNILVEVTVLTKPELVDVPPKDLPSSIKIGKHGLIVKSGYRQGLLLPQVAPENDFDEIEFLNHTCMKAGLPHDAWVTGAEVYSFEGQIFSEKEPNGEIVEKDFNDKACSSE
ncbi:TIGR00296 family protein [Methanolobus mangrovi]|uniref:Protein RE476_07535 n=1 Tax=Methanolobus mangrovi TaxID=3072977 RepID=A0AA51UHP0_9EURY|nr:TIGR00296 family protein [Methanolobus mangrovi]WMW23459.1 TIGR00296 family protein [Methanolobus mangrovi]